MLLRALRLAARLLGASAVLLVLQRVLAFYALKRSLLRRNAHLDPRPLQQGGLLGSLPSMLRNFHRMYDYKLERTRTFGKTYMVQSPFWDGKAMIITADPANVQHILGTQFNIYIKSETLQLILGPLLGEGIFAINHGPHASDGGEKWLFQRKTASKIFTRNVFQGRMYETFGNNAHKIVSRLQDLRGARAIDMQTVFYKFTMDSIGSVGFGVDLNTLDEEKNAFFAESFDAAQKLSARRTMMPFFNVLGRVYPSERALKFHIARMDEFSYDVIEQRLRDPETATKTDILSHFINHFREHEKLDELPPRKQTILKKYLRDIVMSFFIAGRDTTACTLSFAFMILATRPDIEAALFEEIQRELSNQDAPPRLEQLKDGFPYLNGVIMESLRLFPPVPSDGKVAAVDDVLPDGTFAPKGTVVNFDVYSMGHSEALWGKDFDTAKPERWIEKDGVTKKIVEDWAFPVFQPGRRECLGKQLALFEAKVLTVELVRKFTFKMERPPLDPPYGVGITMTVNGGLPLIATPR